MPDPNRPDSRPAPDEEQLAALLQSFRPHPTERFYQRMASAPWGRKTTARRKLSGVPLFRLGRYLWAAPAFIVLLLVAAGLAFPSLPVAARQLMRFFAPNPSDHMTLEVTVPSPNDPEVFGAPGYFSLSLAEVEQLAGFDVKEIVLPEAGSPIPGMAFNGAHYDPELQTVNLRYSAGGNSLYFSQRASGKIEEYSSIGVGAPVERIIVRGVEGEYVAGGWRSTRITPTGTQGALQPGTQVSLDINWDHELPQHILRWQENHVYYEILCTAGLGRKWRLGKDEILQIASYVK